MYRRGALIFNGERMLAIARRPAIAVVTAILILLPISCSRQPGVVIYCAVDEPYASKIFADFQKETGILVSPLYDIESSKSVGLAGKLEAEADRPQADVWWGSEAFLTAKLTREKILAPYVSPSAADIPANFKDKDGMWAGVGLRARVLAIGKPGPGFELKHVSDLLDPRLKGKATISVPTAGATGAHVAALYLLLGQDNADAFFKGLHANDVYLIGGNAESANKVGEGAFDVGLTDSDDVANAQINGGKLTMVVPDQGPDDVGAVTMPTTVGLVAGCRNVEAAKKLIDFLERRETEQKLIDMQFAKWSVRDDPAKGGVKSMKIDYDAAAQIYSTVGARAMLLMKTGKATE
jgi:iron(III) transport system substrate-binding protein